jgi:fatty acid desaturase
MGPLLPRWQAASTRIALAVICVALVSLAAVRWTPWPRTPVARAEVERAALAFAGHDAVHEAAPRENRDVV